MEERVMHIFELLFGDSVRSIDKNEITPENFDERWDSKTHLTLVAALEEEFEISIEPDDTFEMLNGYNSIIDILNNKEVK